MNTPDVVDQLCRDNQGLAWSRTLHWVKRFQALYLKDEFLSAAMEGLWRAAEKYEPAVGRFSTFATTCIDRRIWSVWVSVSRRHAKLAMRPGLKRDVLDHRRDQPGFELEELIEHYAGLMDEPLARLALEMAAAGFTQAEMAGPLERNAAWKKSAVQSYWRTLRRRMGKNLETRYYLSQVSANH